MAEGSNSCAWCKTLKKKDGNTPHHLMLRITDKLLANLIDHSLDWGMEAELDRVMGQEKGVHLKRTVEFIRSLGISFNVWEKQMLMGQGQVEDMTGQV